MVAFYFSRHGFWLQLLGVGDTLKRHDCKVLLPVQTVWILFFVITAQSSKFSHGCA